MSRWLEKAVRRRGAVLISPTKRKANPFLRFLLSRAFFLLLLRLVLFASHIPLVFKALSILLPAAPPGQAADVKVQLGLRGTTLTDIMLPSTLLEQVWEGERFFFWMRIKHANNIYSRKYTSYIKFETFFWAIFFNYLITTLTWRNFYDLTKKMRERDLVWAEFIKDNFSKRYKRSEKIKDIVGLARGVEPASRCSRQFHRGSSDAVLLWLGR